MYKFFVGITSDYFQFIEFSIMFTLCLFLSSTQYIFNLNKKGIINQVDLFEVNCVYFGESVNRLLLGRYIFAGRHFSNQRSKLKKGFGLSFFFNVE